MITRGVNQPAGAGAGWTKTRVIADICDTGSGDGNGWAFEAPTYGELATWSAGLPSGTVAQSSSGTWDKTQTVRTVNGVDMAEVVDRANNSIILLDLLGLKGDVLAKVV